MNRDEAKAQGLKTYASNAPCKHGHDPERFTSNGKCVHCVSQQNKNLHAQKGVEWSRQRYQEQRINILTRQKKARRERGLKRPGPPPRLTEDQRKANKLAWFVVNAEKIRVYQQSRYLRQRKARLEAAKRYREQNPDSCRALKRTVESARRARKRNAPGAHTRADLEDIRRLQRNKCAECRQKLSDSFHADHILPLTKGGSNDRRNIQLLCHRCNSSKGAKHPVEWARWQGRLI